MGDGDACRTHYLLTGESETISPSRGKLPRSLGAAAPGSGERIRGQGSGARGRQRRQARPGLIRTDTKGAVAAGASTAYPPATARQIAGGRSPSMMPLRTILLVDDDLELRDVVVAILAEPGYTVLAAADGYEALRILVDRSVDLLITDV